VQSDLAFRRELDTVQENGSGAVRRLDSCYLLGIFFWREGFEGAFGPDRTGAEGGERGLLGSFFFPATFFAHRTLPS
jgi:hypothetical protein